jgi:TrmH family RNA methyltransferase
VTTASVEEGGSVTPSSPLDRVVVVLDHPQDVVNIATSIRAMKNMGLSRLRVVRPDNFDAYRIEGIAHRSTDVVEATRHFDTLAEAVADCVFVVGTTARARTANRNYVRPGAVAREMLDRAAEGPVALVFGREDRGLDNEALDLCHEVAIVPTAPDYTSLNLAQAVLVLAYELFQASGEGTEVLPSGRRATRAATQEDLETMYAALADGLARIEFYKGTRRDTAVIRTLRTVLGRADLDRRESRLIRAIGFEIGHYLDRHTIGPPPADAPDDSC